MASSAATCRYAISNILTWICDLLHSPSSTHPIAGPDKLETGLARSEPLSLLSCTRPQLTLDPTVFPQLSPGRLSSIDHIAKNWKSKLFQWRFERQCPLQYRYDTVDSCFFLPRTAQSTKVEQRLKYVRADLLGYTTVVSHCRRGRFFPVKLTFVPARARWSSKTLIRTAMASAFWRTSSREGLVERCLTAFTTVVRHVEVKDPQARSSPADNHRL
jgi:hypothetical protein